MKKFLLFGLFTLAMLATAPAQAQHRLGYIDSDYILSKTPEYATVQQNLDRMAQEWQRELETRQQEVEDLFREYQARELLYTQDERQRKRESIVEAEEGLERLRMQYFGPEGELFRQQDQLLRPIQERILAAVEAVAQEEGYDYVFDKNGDFVFLYVPEDHDLSDRVLTELGIEIDEQATGQGR